MVFAQWFISKYDIVMSFIFESVKSKPVALYAANTSGSLIDWSGYSNTPSFQGGTPPAHISLFAGASHAFVLGDSKTIILPTPVFKVGDESDSFSIEAWVRPIIDDAGPAEQQILGNDAQMDGLVIEGNRISFVTKYATTGEARASYFLHRVEAVHVVGVHTRKKNILIVNGEVVDEVAITEEQQSDTYVATSNNFRSGTTLGTQKIAVGAFGIYAYAMESTIARRHYRAGLSTIETDDIANINNGEVVETSIENANVMFDYVWDDEADWHNSISYSALIENNELRPQQIDGVSTYSEWIDSIYLGVTGLTSMYAVTIDWIGEGATVEVSLDGDTWTAVAKNTRIGLIENGFDPTDKNLLVRVSFAGNITDDESVVSMLRITGFSANSTPTKYGRILIFNDGFQESEYSSKKLVSSWGASIQSGGSLVVTQDISVESKPLRSFSIWIKPTGITMPTISVSGTTYVNGEPSPLSFMNGEWQLIHVVLAADNYDGFTITGPAQVGPVTVYPTALTASDVANAYNALFLLDSLVVTADSSIQVLDSLIPVDIYAHEWAIQASG